MCSYHAVISYVVQHYNNCVPNAPVSAALVVRGPLLNIIVYSRFLDFEIFNLKFHICVESQHTYTYSLISVYNELVEWISNLFELSNLN